MLYINVHYHVNVYTVVSQCVHCIVVAMQVVQCVRAHEPSGRTSSGTKTIFTWVQSIAEFKVKLIQKYSPELSMQERVIYLFLLNFSHFLTFWNYEHDMHVISREDIGLKAFNVFSNVLKFQLPITGLMALNVNNSLKYILPDLLLFCGHQIPWKSYLIQTALAGLTSVTKTRGKPTCQCGCHRMHRYGD